MESTSTYQPEWISEEEACKWLGLNKSTLFKYRSSKGLAWTNINNRSVMYDRKQIQEILNENSTYKIEGRKLTA